ncbi:MAG: hypothetical protein GWM90_32975, partial [Gemmatimonadetes bacterium]|nr:hypothetical protein [Gemmatimonadota bacterium]NIQ60125.1 hypothetical protein [Gemmatimonadota bacterium]NIU80339.1 hypothetical protein [Gammaproteobacteria bacterium]NIX48698.1 hypothetical protein [Gemmatimonadota bacterium]NIY13151.1 hypothetical protein [Gemmatimonadota bacterium]
DPIGARSQVPDAVVLLPEARRIRDPEPIAPPRPGRAAAALRIHQPGERAALPGAGFTAVLDRSVSITGRADLRLARGLAVTGAGVRYAVPGGALEVGVEATIALPGRDVPLEYRGRTRRFTIGFSVPPPGIRSRSSP